MRTHSHHFCHRRDSAQAPETEGTEYPPLNTSLRRIVIGTRASSAPPRKKGTDKKVVSLVHIHAHSLTRTHARTHVSL